MAVSPYAGLPVTEWQQRTRQLIAAHPLDTEEIVRIVLVSWEGILASEIGSKPFRIGVDLFPAPQIMGFFLHELIPMELADRHPALWRKGVRTHEKDVEYIPDNAFSIEIKTSSSGQKIYGNRSYAQSGSLTYKDKSGYYLAINFEKIALTHPRPKISLIRFGWLDHTDWIGQTAATGQQARLSSEVERNKLLILPLGKE